MELTNIVNAVKEIGFVPVLVILMLLFQFRTIVRLEKYNEMLVKHILKMKGGQQNGNKDGSRDIPYDSSITDSNND
ncbi:MAG: hypothetical protein HQK96_21525 [Nitrospirae bacterium]|nr:hypothetical protein [Nitrospirota bacterium]